VVMIASRVLHRLLGLLVLGAVLLLVAAPAARPGDQGVPPPSVSRLTWGPPPCGAGGHGCVDLYLQNTGLHQEPELLPSVDYRIHLPVDGPLAGGLTISGGHDVQIIGGQIDLTTPCDDASSACRGILIRRDAPGEVYIEGVYIRNPDPSHAGHTSDGIAVDDQPGANATDLTVQNVRIEGIDGCDPVGDPAAHADVFQPWAAGDAVIRFDRVTGTTDCQGLQVDPDVAWSRDHTTALLQDFRNVNIVVESNPHTGDVNRYAAWFTYGDSSCIAAPTLLRDVYVDEPDGTLGANSVWPDVDRPLGCESLWDPTSGRRSFPLLPRIDGVITAGRPPEGDFVPAGSVGIGYTSPGYADAATASGVVSRPVGSSSRRRSASRRGTRRLRSHRRVLPR
jgi:hypothetical protein